MNDIIIAQQLSQMVISYDKFTLIRSKDGVYVYRVFCGSHSYVLKYFENIDDRREIMNYEILYSLKVPTIPVIAIADSSLLMEDIDQSNVWRLGIKNDLNDTQVARQIALWYKHLHYMGKVFLFSYEGDMYDESDCFTLENIALIIQKTATGNNPVWQLICDNFQLLKTKIEQIEKTLNYNDFYYTNLIVSKDKSSAFMFDYNLLGKGYVYADIRNVCSSLGKDAKEVFINEYGTFNPNEIIVDDVLSPITGLVSACKREIFPGWADEEVQKINDGTLLNSINKLLKL